MIDQAVIRSLVPHAGGMCLLEAVDSWDELEIRCRTLSHRDPQNPLRSGDRLAALHLCEYGAQAMAVHGGLLAQRHHGSRAAAGMLAALRDVEFAVDRIDDIERPLTVVACKQIAWAGGLLYSFEISAGDRWLARGRVSVMQPRPATAAA